MRSLKKIAVCGAVVALMGAVSAPAMADRFPEGPGKPMTTGLAGGASVIHCQVAMDFLVSVGVFPPGDTTYPGVILLQPTPDGTYTHRSLGPRPCPALIFL